MVVVVVVVVVVVIDCVVTVVAVLCSNSWPHTSLHRLLFFERKCLSLTALRRCLEQAAQCRFVQSVHVRQMMQVKVGDEI